MNLSAAFIARPVATILLTIGITLAGAIAFTRLPVAPLPQVEFPVISVYAQLPGASPETMAATVATPLERQLGRIAGVNEITSSSSQGSTRVSLQFDLDRSIHKAANEVQAAINAARAQLPSGMPGNPTYRKANPADPPIIVLTLVSDTLPKAQLYDAASTIVAQRLSQIRGVGQVNIGGGSLPAVRVEVNPRALSAMGVGLADVRTALTTANVNRPKGVVEEGERQWWIYANDQLMTAEQYALLIVAYRNGAPVRLRDVATVSDSVQDLRNSGAVNGRPAILLWVYKEPDANVLDTVDRVNEALPWLRASIPAAMELSLALERTATIRASLREVEKSLVIAVGLVVLVVFLLLRHVRATLIPAAAVPVSIISTFGFMYLAGYSLNNLSLMALIVATGFVVDDAIVVLENAMRHIEAGASPMAAALKSAREVGFTVISMSISLVAVFIPILFLSGLVGRFFREFALTLTAAVGVSLVVSLTLTPMMCAHMLKPASETAHGLFYRAGERVYLAVLRAYAATLRFALRHSVLTMLALVAMIGLNVHLYNIIPKGFFPQQDTGRIFGYLRADQASSFQSTSAKMEIAMKIIQADPAIDTITSSTGSGFGARNFGSYVMSLKPLAERKVSAAEVVARLRPQLARIPGIQLSLVPVSDVRIGGRPGTGAYQYTLQSENVDALREWTQKLTVALQNVDRLTDVSSDQEVRGMQATVVVDRPTAARLGLSIDAIDQTLGNAFSQAIVSTIYTERNQYRVVMEVDPRYAVGPESLKDIWLRTPTGQSVPLSAIARYEFTNTPLSINHQGQFASATISFSLPEGVSLSDATVVIRDMMDRIGVPSIVFGGFAGTARTFQTNTGAQPWLIVAAIVAMYIVLGMLYESFVHPITILSTLPSAGVGALLALLAAGAEFTVIALIAVFLLIGIVKKNAILMVDFALDAERTRGRTPREAIYEACILRFRPIMMTTLAAALGALPLALGVGDGAELRKPLGIAIVGGLALSQVLTLYTTPVVYLYLERMRLWTLRRWQMRRGDQPRSAAA